MENENKLVCSTCQKTFSSVSTKNRHLKTVHNKKVEEKKSQYIKCPICPEEKKEPLVNHDSLIHHLTKVHSLIIKESMLNFANMEEFEIWRAEQSREVDYVCSRKIKHPSGEVYLYYNCNRANSRGFQSNCTKRAMRTGGSIRISGICPSKIVAKRLRNGGINVKFTETHVGHENDLKTKRLLKKEQTKNNQHKKTVKAHKKAEEIKGSVELVEFGSSDMRKENSEGNLLIEEPMHYDDDLKETSESQKEGSELISSETSIDVREELVNYINSLDREALEKLTRIVRTFKNNLEQEQAMLKEKN